MSSISLHIIASFRGRQVIKAAVKSVRLIEFKDMESGHTISVILNRDNTFIMVYPVGNKIFCEFFPDDERDRLLRYFNDVFNGLL